MTMATVISISTRRAFLRRCVEACAGLGAARAWADLSSETASVSVSPDLDRNLPDASRSGSGPVSDPGLVSGERKGVSVYPRAAWNPAPLATGGLKVAGDFSRITVHHSGASNAHTKWDTVVRDLNGILVGHLDKNYADIGYHFIVDAAGRIWEGRSLDFEGAHVANQNEGNVGIMLLGNFDIQTPARAQVVSLQALVRELCRQHWIGAECVFGHCDLGHSACPGKHLYGPYVQHMRCGDEEGAGNGKDKGRQEAGRQIRPAV